MFDRIKPAQTARETDNMSSVPRMTLTVDQLCEELNISRTTAYHLVREEGFPSLMIGHRVIINRAGLQQWLDRKSGN